jgi:hypothetical protein
MTGNSPAAASTRQPTVSVSSRWSIGLSIGPAADAACHPDRHVDAIALSSGQNAMALATGRPVWTIGQVGRTRQPQRRDRAARTTCAAATTPLLSSVPMRISSFTHRCRAWIALVALMVNALAPAAMHGTSSAMPGNFFELCTTAGIERIAFGAGNLPDNDTDNDGDARPHCPFCLAQHLPFIPLPDATAPLPQADGAAVLPPLFLHAPRPLFAWAAPQPRAPPVSV